MAAPQALVDLVNSLHLEGIPSGAAPGEQINPRLVPDLAPLPGGLPNPTLEGLADSVTLATIEADLAPIVSYIAQTLGIDVTAVLDAVEFAPPGATTADGLDVSSTIVRNLPHLVPSSAVGNPLQLSPNVEGLIAKAEGALTFTPDEIPSTVTATIGRPAVLAAVPTVTVGFRLTDEAGTPLVPIRDYMGSTVPFAPSFVLFPAVFDPVGNPPSSVSRNFFCDVTVNYTPIGGSPETLSRTIGPVSVDLATTLVPLVAVLTEHAVTDSRFPGRVFMGVPGNSPLGSAGDAFAVLTSLGTILTNIVTVLGLIGIPVPAPVSSAVLAINTVLGRSVGRFRKGDLIGFWEWSWGIPPWDDWQGIFSAVFVFGPSTRRIFLGSPVPLTGFSVTPATLGVAAVSDLSIFPLTTSVGSAVQNFPAPPAVPPGGSFNDLATSINFPVP